MRPDGPSSADGLTSAEAASRLRHYGHNTVRDLPRPGVVHKVATQLRDPMILLLLGASALTTMQGDVADTAVIVLVVLLNTAVGVSQEVRAERAVTALRAMAAPHARVMRDGVPQVVVTGDLVPGDLLLLDAGDIVGADATVLESYLLQTDDSALTGESMPQGKPPGAEVYAGTTVTRGRGRAVVTGTGPDSSLGRITTMVAAARPGPTPLQRRLTRLGQQLTIAAVAVSTLVLVLGVLRGMTLGDAALTAASLAVAAVPESLPAVLTLSLALGAHRMARRHAIARELRAVETLGSVTLLATDKTGTLTENRMVVERVWTPFGEYAVRGPGYDPSGVIEPVGGPDAPDQLLALLEAAVLCNDAEIGPDERGDWRAVGDPTEAALVTLARRGGVDVERVRAEHPRVAEVPFESERAWMVTRHRRPAGGDLVVCKGAPEEVLPRLHGGAELATAQRWADARAAEGYRVLVVAAGAAAEEALAEDELPGGLELLGLAAMTDPPRTEVVDVLRALDEAGVRVVVMTGDHPATAEAVARRVGLLVDGVDGKVRTGADLDRAVAAGDTAHLADATLYARVRPEHKLALVQAWQQAGDVVAVTGDGVNDGPALRTAAIGVAMGRGGTEVARQASDLVLTDDRLGTVVAAVEEGRRIQQNLRRFLRYALSGGLAEVIYVLSAPLWGFAIPLLPAQILWINMLTHGLPGVAMGAEPVAEGTMRRRPVAVDAPVIDRSLTRRIAVTGTLIAVVTTVAALLTRDLGGHARTSAFLVLGLAQLGVALALRDRGAARRNRFLSVAVAGAVVLQAAGALLPPLQGLLGTESLSARIWLYDALLAMLPGALLWLWARSVAPRVPGAARRTSASGRRGVGGTGMP